MANVLLLKCFSQYDAMRYYIDEIEIGFRLAGYHTIVVDATGEAGDMQIRELQKSVKIDYIFTCNAVMLSVLELFSDAIYVTYLCDHPALLWTRLEALREKDIVFVCDALYAAYAREFFPNLKNVEFIPLSGSYFPKLIPYAERDQNVVFTGSYEKPQTIYQSCIGHMEGSLKYMAEYMLKEIIEEPDQTLDMCLRKAMERFEAPDLSKSEFNQRVNSFREVDAYARMYYRDKMIRALVENGITVHVYGNGWEDFESDYKENLILEKGNAYLARKAVANARISLNIMPWFKAGFQERIATAMLSGTVAVTDESAYINENFENGKDLVTYSLKHIEKLPEKIQYLLEHEEEAAQIANAGMQHEMTWQHRTFSMINYIRQCEGKKEHIPSGSYGQVLQIPYEHLCLREVGLDALKDTDELLETVYQLQAYDKVELCDVEYLYKRFQFLYLRTKANFPSLTHISFIHDYLMNAEEKNPETAAEMLIVQCTTMKYSFLHAEYEVIKAERDHAKKETAALDITSHEQEVTIKKILRNYSQSSDEEIREILQNISQNRKIYSYNQNFAKKYACLTKDVINEVYYDEQAQMYYVFWNGKKMYYPKSYTRDAAAVGANFTRMEQDPESPHRYFTDSFSVEEGDIVIDAGAAEGNFALDIIDQAKKVYLVESDPMWVEALEKTFEPWKEKAVIITKMLDAYDDETHTTIDSFVEEQEVNFIKMDVEGAEMASLEGAANIIKNSAKLKCAVCAYHRKNDLKDIREKLEQEGFFTSLTKGYIFFQNDIESWIDGELRRGMIRAVKNHS